MISTELTRLLGIRVPVVQGGMQWVGLPQLAGAVSEAGGLGILTALTQPSPDALRQAIRDTRKITSKPFAVNLTFLPTISPPPYMDYAKVVVEEGVKIAETAGGPDAKPIIQYYKQNNVFVIHKCTSIRHALSAQKLGVDMLSVDGFECAGHPGEDDIGGLVLLARAAQELKVPFLASGGFANGQGLAGALALGACGINAGSLFMATDEAPIHDNIKKIIVDSTERDTIHIFRTFNNTARVYKNKIAKEVVAIERRPGGAKFEDVRELVSGQRGKTVYTTGDSDAGIWSAGTAVGLITKVQSCKSLLDEIERDAEAIINRMSSMTQRSKL
ncbi:uncharacterized protein L969DRAFT_91433 [Mixia osmundae IAM 14324]|uniref:Uncharacterized protein n=1 Tax=Mixia osmundae (strain CBS 9802 / IAM 14324 / JCM 22182 / KY 12970) TaxID=764103 RepID=G7E3W0_MIXOS|nr:uncharacterized protein L969DRAFT_91433 [Mixia osmundae IAM 14324]KEI41965.1 hypothetical protein L969DRAFT_91433 [Mixia osmundae IAM 14324]GAA97520.1 hypothetical protein E5Q_04198 [Mixia osmundae IAM 14324]